MRVSKWGNSLAIRLPAAAVAALRLKAGDEVEVIGGDSASIVIARINRREAMLERLRALQGRLPVGFRFDRDTAHDQ